MYCTTVRNENHDSGKKSSKAKKRKEKGKPTLSVNVSGMIAKMFKTCLIPSSSVLDLIAYLPTCPGTVPDGCTYRVQHSVHVHTTLGDPSPEEEKPRR